MSRYCFSTNQHRLKTSKEFSVCFDKTDKKVINQSFILLAVKNNLSVNRLGLVIAKKHIKHAVKRNLVKRILRENFRLQENNSHHYDIVILSRYSIDTSRLALNKQTSHLFKKWNKT